jgi:hypothetical protein
MPRRWSMQHSPGRSRKLRLSLGYAWFPLNYVGNAAGWDEARVSVPEDIVTVRFDPTGKYYCAITCNLKFIVPRRSVWLALLAIAASTAKAAGKQVSFAKEIKPIFQASCWTCVGAAIQLSRLDLRTRRVALKIPSTSKWRQWETSGIHTSAIET